MGPNHLHLDRLDRRFLKAQSRTILKKSYFSLALFSSTALEQTPAGCSIDSVRPFDLIIAFFVSISESFFTQHRRKRLDQSIGRPAAPAQTDC